MINGKPMVWGRTILENLHIYVTRFLLGPIQTINPFTINFLWMDSIVFEGVPKFDHRHP